MKSMGTKQKSPEVAATAKDKSPKISYPSFSISSKALPDVTELRINDTLELKCKVRVKGLHEGWDDKKEHVCDFDMTACEISEMPSDMGEARRKNLNRKDLEELNARKK